MRMILNETSYFGAGCRSELKVELKKRGMNSAIVFTDADLIKFGVSKMVTDILDEEKIAYTVFSSIKANPTIANVHDGIKAFDKAKPNVIIAIGGGSVMDTAKAVGIIAVNREFCDVKSLEGIADTKNKSFPIVTFATTAGTAAEVTVNYVITAEDEQRKLVCIDPNDIPLLTFNDAEMMVSKPKGLTAATGMDALTHAIEGYITLGANPLSDILSQNAIKLIAGNLEKAVANGKDISAREGMALGSYVAGMSFSNVGLGIVHSMAHPLGARFDTPHGIANAILLPYVMEYNKSAALEKYSGIATAFGIDVSKMTAGEAADAAISAVKKLSKAVGIPEKLSEIGIKKESLTQLAEDAFVDPCTGGNPRETSVSDILKIYQTAF